MTLVGVANYLGIPMVFTDHSIADPQFYDYLLDKVTLT